MRFALGQLKWSPADFWKSTPHEIVAASEGLDPDFIARIDKQKRMNALEMRERKKDASRN